MALNINRPGQDNGAGDNKALYETEFTNELIEVLNRKTITNGMVTTKKVRNAKAFSFKNTGDVGIGQSWDGVELSGMDTMRYSETIISIEPRVYTIETLAEDDEAMNNFETRGPILRKMANKLANRKDSDRINEMIKGSRMPNKIAGLNGGGEIINVDLASADTAVKGAAIYDSILAGSQMFFEKDVTETPDALVGPSEFTALRKYEKVINNLYNGGQAGIDNGVEYLYVENIKVMRTNNLKRVNSTLAGDNFSEYHGVDATNVYIVLVNSGGIGAGELIDDAVRFVKKDDSFATKIIASYVAGIGVISPLELITCVDVHI